jgi:hypothetical protein
MKMDFPYSLIRRLVNPLACHSKLMWFLKSMTVVSPLIFERRRRSHFNNSAQNSSAGRRSSVSGMAAQDSRATARPRF